MSTGTPELFRFVYIQDLLAQTLCWGKAATLFPDWLGSSAWPARLLRRRSIYRHQSSFDIIQGSHGLTGGEWRGISAAAAPGLCHAAVAQKLRGVLPDSEELKPWVQRDLQLCPRSHGRELPASEGAAATEHWAAPEGTALWTDFMLLERLNQDR